MGVAGKNAAVIGAGLGALLLLGGAGCSPKVEPVPDVRPVRTLTVARVATQATNTYAGEVKARYESALAFRVGGKIVARKVDVGTQVKAGQVLMQLDPRDLTLAASSAQAQVAAAQAQANVAQLDLERVRGLHAKGFASQAEFDRYETQYKAAKAQYEAAAAQADQVANQTRYAVLTADADGTVTALNAEAGQVVAAGQPVVQVARQGEVEIASALPEDQLSYVAVGMPVTVSLWAQQGRTYPGRIRELSSSADPYSRTYAVRVSVPDAPPEMRLRMTASVSIPLHGLPDLVHVPAPAMVTQQGKVGVWLVSPQDSTIRFRPTEFAGVQANDVLVASGLEPGDVVVTAGAAFLHEGQKVRILGALPAPSAAQVPAPAASPAPSEVPATTPASPPPAAAPANAG